MAQEQVGGRRRDSTPLPVPAGGGGRGRPARLDSLTGVRFFAASGVVFAHAMTFGADGPAPEVVSWLGMSAVTLFFILSGYVLTHSWRPGDTARAFWRRRAAKVLPNHVLTWGGALLVTAVVGTALTPRDPGALADVAALLLVHTWVSPEYALAGNVVAWSLAAEALFYLLFPALIPLVLRLTRRGCLALAAVSLVVLWSLPLFCALLIDPHTMDGIPQGSDASWFLYVLPAARLPQFLLGMVVARLSVLAPELPRIGVLRVCGLLTVTLLAGSAWLPDAFMCSAVTTFSLALLIHAVSGLDLRGEWSLLRTRVAVFLGEISYALYLVHFQILILTHHVTSEHGWSRGPALTLALTLTLLMAWLLYVSVERPFMRRFARPRPRPRTQPPEVSRGRGRPWRPGRGW
ncbi:acyltransferase [Streptomyces sp. N2-109]|uniref:Acyltransferase n=1 Tax=Streptomyces gossypii TaxID=2883101 RepID=A0ABT2JQJ1_9ACTN|nr:acyltransferase [Streptomyces gossypii]MCT2590158.1 acyltransferase [Streptomyces gossypii]